MARTQIDKSLIASINSSANVGTTTNNSAAAGIVGEYIEGVIGYTNFPSTGVFGDLTSVSLTAGDWEVTAVGNLNRNSATVTDYEWGVSITAGNSVTGLVVGSNYFQFQGTTALATIQNIGVVVPAYRISISSTTTVYFKYACAYTVAIPQLAGRLSARRMR